MQELTEQEHDELVNAEFTISGKRQFIGQVVDIDYDIGITIIERGNKDNYLLCLIGSTVLDLDEPELYQKLFNTIIKGIKKGNINLRELGKIVSGGGWHRHGTDPSSETCAFNK